MPSPITEAAAIAKRIRDDPVAAAQVREHIPVGELIELLGIHLADLLQATPPEEGEEG